MKALLKFSAIALFGLSLAACAGDHIRWTEEVKLCDGSVIQIQRHIELTESGFPVSSRGFDKYHEICYPPLGIHWKSRGGYQPDIFDIVDGKAYVHVPVSSNLECREQGYPKDGAIYFVWESDRWKRISNDEFPTASEWNLLRTAKRGSTSTDARGLITMADKASGEFSDRELRVERKRLGWKRINESYARRQGCKPYENVQMHNYGSTPKREDCSRNERSTAACPVSIFIEEDKAAACQKN